MNTLEEQDEWVIDDRRNTQRDLIRHSLDEIAKPRTRNRPSAIDAHCRPFLPI